MDETLVLLVVLLCVVDVVVCVEEALVKVVDTVAVDEVLVIV